MLNLTTVTLYFGLSQTQLSCLRSMQNSLARTVVSAPRSCHISPVLESLHWLKINQCIDLKYFILHTSLSSVIISNPSYLHQMLLPQKPRSTRSSCRFKLLYPCLFSQIFYRSFRHAAPHLWSQFPLDLRPSSLHLSSSALPACDNSPTVALTLAAFYLNLKHISSSNNFYLSSYASMDSLSLSGCQPRIAFYRLF
jgi:hypothetical protein